MKRFLLFTGDFYYPGGGWEDFIQDFDSFEEAREAGRQTGDNWYQIVDAETMEEIGGR